MAESSEQHNALWERRQAELWDRIFQVSQDVVTLADSMDAAAGTALVRKALVEAALRVGSDLVRANAAEDADDFAESLQEARLAAVEADYWLRMTYLLQSAEEVQRDLSSIITQYAAVVDLLQKFIRHARDEQRPLKHFKSGPRVSLG